MVLTAFWGVSALATYNTLPSSRFLTFNDYDDPVWTHSGANAPPFIGAALRDGTIHEHAAGWVLTDVRSGYAGSYGRVVPPEVASNLAANLRNVNGAEIKSPYYADGLGTLYLDAVNSEASTSFMVYIATNMIYSGGGIAQMQPTEDAMHTYNWVAVHTQTLNFSSNFGRFAIKVNYPGAIRFKIVRPSATPGYPADDQFLVIDNIQASYPAPYVAIAQLSAKLTPVPDFSAGTLSLRCVVDQYNAARANLNNTAVTLWYRTAPEEGGLFGPWSSAALAYVAGTGNGSGMGREYEIALPIAKEGAIEYYYSCSFDGHFVPQDYTGTGFNYPYPSESLSPQTLYEDGMGGSNPFDRHWAFGAVPPVTELPDERILTFDDYDDLTKWTHTGANAPPFIGAPLRNGTEHTHVAGWVVSNARTGYSRSYGRIVPQDVATNYACNFRNAAGCYIASPFYGDGIGTLYFEAVNSKLEIALHVYWAVDMYHTNTPTYIEQNVMLPEEQDGYKYNWRLLNVLNLNYNAQGEFARYSRLLNYRGAARVKIVRESATPGYAALDDQFLVVDNVRISPPPTDLFMMKSEVVSNPGYPNAEKDFTVRCSVYDIDHARVPTETRSVYLVSRWRYLDQTVESWQTNQMEYVQNTPDGVPGGEIYEITVPAPGQEGDLEYYFTCFFGGYVYESPDYTGTGFQYPYPSESLSPRPLRNTVPGAGEFSIRLRPYDSRYGALYVVTDQHDQPIRMDLVGDHQWRGMVPLAAVTPTSLTWSLMAVNEHVGGGTTYETNVLYWANAAPQSGPLPTLPYGGLCVLTNGTERIAVSVTDGGYMEVSFDSETLAFLANRAEYQNFNTWTARDEYFSESSGQADKQRFMNTFNQWEITQDQTFIEPFVAFLSTTNVYHRDPFTTPLDWVAGSAAYVVERTLDTIYNPPGINNYRNLALRLKGGDPALGLGYVYNKVATLPDGIKEFGFKARVGQPSKPIDICYHRNYFTSFNYSFKISTSSGKKSPERPSISVVAYYQDYNNFYEFRVVQIPDYADNVNSVRDKRASLSLYKWVGGEPSLVGVTHYPDANIDLSIASPVRVTLYNTSASSTKIKCHFANAVIERDDNSNPYKSGSLGFVSSECFSGFYDGTYQAASSTADPTGTANNILGPNAADVLAQQPNWFVPVGVYSVRTDVSSPGVYKVVPNQKLDVFVQPTNYSSQSSQIPPPVPPGAQGWTFLKQISVNDFEYQSVLEEFREWRSHYVLLQVSDGESDVVVDELKVSSWHGRKIGIGDIDDDEWLATEAWIVPEAAGPAATNHIMHLDLTRANPAVAQAVRSRLLDNGLGMMEFDFRVLTPPARITVQYADKSDFDTWSDVQSFYVSNVTDWAHASAYLGDAEMEGYFRVLNNRAGGYANALVEIDNLAVWDEPFVDVTSWKSYNARITATDSMRLLLDEGKSCYLNNSLTDQTNPTLLDRDRPNLQSPVLVNGLGQISLLARAYNPGNPATLYLYASTNGWQLLAEEWILIHQFENIDHQYYKPYSFKPVDGSMYNAIRLETVAGVGLNRLCVDEVVISEPVYPGFDIVNVNLKLMERDGTFGDRAQPLPFEDVHVEAMIANQQLAPSNIVMYVSYYIGNDIWGAENWFSAPESVTRRMHPVDGEPNVYRTRDDEGDVVGLPPSQIGGITGQDAGTVVQYRVWASYMGGIPLFEYQSMFVNPAWYYPVNYNVSRAAEGWSPYYIVYSVPPATVWVNEINVSDFIWDGSSTKHGIWENAYIEIAVPAWLDLGGWKVDLVTQSSYEKHTIQIPAGLPQQVAVTNGYAFFVIAEAIPPYQQTPALTKVDFAYAGLASLMPQIVPGGIRLRRPEGMYEQTIAYDDAVWNSGGAFYDGNFWAENDPEGFFRYVGEEKNKGSLSRVGQGDSTNTWVYPLFPQWGQDHPDFAKNYTPGMPNGLQWLPNGDELFPGTSNVMIRSNLSQLKATQNGKRVINYSLRMRVGSQTNITYNVDEWYRLVSVRSNGVEQLPAGTQLTGYAYGLEDISSDVDLQATINLREDLVDYQGDSSVINWILGFPEAPLVPMFYNGRQLTLTEQYWLDANPTISNRFECVIRDFYFDGQTNLHVRLEMKLNESNMAHIQGSAVLKLESKQSLHDSSWDMIKQFYLTVDSFDSNNQCHAVVNNPFEFILTNYSRKRFFLRWVIELEDPRVSVYELENAVP